MLPMLTTIAPVAYPPTGKVPAGGSLNGKPAPALCRTLQERPARTGAALACMREHGSAPCATRSTSPEAKPCPLKTPTAELGEDHGVASCVDRLPNGDAL